MFVNIFFYIILLAK